MQESQNYEGLETLKNEPKPFKVFAIIDEKNRVLSIQSTCFANIPENAIVIKEGFGDEYVHIGIKYPMIRNENQTHVYYIDEDGNIQKATEEMIAEELNEIHEATITAMDLTKLKQLKIQESKDKLAVWCADNPIVIDIKGSGIAGTYTVTKEKQDELSKMLKLIDAAQELGVELKPTWNETGKQCEIYTKHQLQQLSLAIMAHVYPNIEKQRMIEVEIMKCETPQEVLAIEIFYDNATIIEIVEDEVIEEPVKEEIIPENKEEIPETTEPTNVEEPVVEEIIPEDVPQYNEVVYEDENVEEPVVPENEKETTNE